MVQTILFRLASIFIIVILFTNQIHGQRAIFDEFGNETGLTNLNPDPDGEPWIAGGMKPMTPAQELRAAQIPELEVPEEIVRRQLPSEVVLVDDPEFAPIFNQAGGSCAQASGVSYLYSFQINVLEGVSATSDNTRAYGYTHNFLNNGKNSSGSWYWDGWDIIEKTGCPTKKTFHGALNGGLSGTRYMDGYDRWHTANDNRITEQFKISIKSMADIDKMKNWFYDQNGANADKKGGCLVFAAKAGSASSNSTVQSGPYAGEPLCTKLSAQDMDHAMTFAGYCDEAKAVLLVNSWGNWENKGTVWVSYNSLINGGLYKDEVQGVKVGRYVPKLECKIKVSHSSRKGLTLTTGFSNNVNATSPAETKNYKRAFKKTGGTHPLGGKGGPQEIEIGLDISEFADMITGGDAKIFLVASSSSGSGKIISFSVMDYTSGPVPQEFICDESNVTIGTSTTLSVILSSSPTISFVSPSAGQEVEQFTKHSIKWGDNIDGKVKIELYKGSSLKETLASSTESDGEFVWDIPADQELGDDYTIKVISIDDPSVNDESAAFSVIAEILIAEFPYIQDFEDMDTGAVRPLSEYWEQLDGDDFDWIVINGPTPSQQYESTGPTGDHTSGSGKYIYIEASNQNNPTKKADMITPKFNLKSVKNPELTFWAQMKSDSNTMGDIYLDIEVDGIWKNDVLHLTDDHGSEWFEVKQDLTNYVGERVRFRFRGITGESWCGDMCIDDFIIDAETANNPVAIAPVVSYNLHYAGAYLMYSIPEIQGLGSRQVSLKLYNVQGQLVQTLVNNSVPAGRHMIRVDKLQNNGRALATGLYVCRMEAGVFTQTVTVILK